MNSRMPTFYTQFMINRYMLRLRAEYHPRTQLGE